MNQDTHKSPSSMRWAGPRVSWPPALGALVAGGLVFVTASLLACQDHPTAAEAWIVSQEMRPALDFNSSLPVFTDLIPVEGTGDWAALAADWEQTWDLGAAQGRRAREEVYRAVEPLMDRVSRSAAESAVEAVRTAIAEAQTVSEPLPLHLMLPFDEAQRLLAKAAVATADGRWGEGAITALLAADALRETMPRTVALTLVEAAEGALKATVEVDGRRTLAPPDHLRARRLSRWARAAIDEGVYVTAIQRAYYACQLLGVILP